MDSPSETSFVRQSLADTLTATARPSKAPLRSLHTNAAPPQPPPPPTGVPSTVTKHRPNPSLSTATKKPRPVNSAAGEDEADGLLRRLGLVTADGSTMEDASFSASARHPGVSPSEAFATPRARPRKLPAGPSDFLPPAQREAGELEKERDALKDRCRVLEEELRQALEAREGGTAGEKVLGAKQYEELERQFDAQEKLLSGYQRENERSMIELNAQKRKMEAMSAALAKAYGHDWEASLGISSPGANVVGSPAATAPLTTAAKRSSIILSTAPLASPSLADAGATEGRVSQAQLEMVHDLIRSMERRLIQSEGDLLGLRNEAREEADRFDRAISGIQQLVASKQ